MIEDPKKTTKPEKDPFEEHKREQILRLSKLTMEQKLEWLEEAHKRVMRMKGDSENKAEK